MKIMISESILSVWEDVIGKFSSTMMKMFSVICREKKPVKLGDGGLK